MMMAAAQPRFHPPPQLQAGPVLASTVAASVCKSRSRRGIPYADLDIAGNSCKTSAECGGGLILCNNGVCSL